MYSNIDINNSLGSFEIQNIMMLWININRCCNEMYFCKTIIDKQEHMFYNQNITEGEELHVSI